ncbi:MAG: type IV secretion system protein [Legionellales bacterium]|nr:type IV secretion system protein [Legionellales bacterium]
MLVDNLIQTIFTQTHTLLQQFVFQGFQAFANLLQTPFIEASVLASALGCCFILYKPEWFKSILYSTILTISIVAFLGFSWSHASQLIYNVFTKTPVNLINQVIHSLGIPIAGNSIESGLQAVLSQLVVTIQAFWALGHLTNIEPYFFAIITFFITLLLMMIAIYELLYAQIGLAISFVLTPLFLPLALFKFTKSIYTNWLSRCIGMSLTIIFVNLMLVLVLQLCQSSLQAVMDTLAENRPLYFSLLIPFFIVGGMCVGLIYKVAQEAQMMASGMGSQSGFESAVTGMAAVASASGIAGAASAASHKAKDVAGKSIGKATRAVGKHLFGHLR